MLTVRIVPEVDPRNGEVYLNVYRGNVCERVGPLQDGEEQLAILEEPDPSAGRAPPNARIKRLSKKQERRNAASLGGRTQPGSGSSSRAKGDVRKLGEYRGESKFTFAQSYALERAVLEKIASECGEGEKPILFLDYKNKDTGRTHGSYVVLHETDFEELVHHASSDNRRPFERPKK